MPQDLVALHSAVCSRGIRNIFQIEDSQAIIWSFDSENLSINKYDIQIYPIIKIQFDTWTLYTDQWLLDKIFSLREKRLPNETGGILIGSFDMQRKIVYVSDTVPSPPDSLEWPTVYIRGCQGLKVHVNQIKKTTGGMLDYIGEWHSHPNNSGTSPSTDDLRAFEWLAELMDIASFPTLMMISGDQGQYSFYLGTMQ